MERALTEVRPSEVRSRYFGAAIAASGFSAAIALLALLGWTLDSAQLKGLMFGSWGRVAMNPMTAACFLLASAALALLTSCPKGILHRNLASWMSVLVLSVGALKLSQLLGWENGVDRWLFASSLDRSDALRPNRMAPNTAFCFVLVGSALLLLDRTNARGRAPSEGLALAAMAISGLALTGYAYGAESFMQVTTFIPMALNTALAFAALSVGILCARPDRGVMALVCGPGSGGLAIRRLLPAVVGIPLALGWLRLKGQEIGHFSTEFGASLMTVAVVAFLAVIVWACSRQIEGLDRRLRETVRDLEILNSELESFSYSVSHDLRAPLRSMVGFSQAVLEDHGTSLPAEAQGYLRRIRASGQRMSQLIDGLLVLSRVSRSDLRLERVDLSSIAREVLATLAAQSPGRQIDCRVESDLVTEGDPRLLLAVMENLLENAWKFTSKAERARIEFRRSGAGPGAFQVSDNGAGFEMAYAEKLFRPFQRLHSESEFGGTGVGLATVRRILQRHGGWIRAEGAPGRGATFSFAVDGVPGRGE